MVPIAGRPFLEYIFDDLARQGFGRVVLAVGYRADAIMNHFGTRFGPISIAYSEEETPLGTGGAAWKALALADTGLCFTLNGDTWIDLDYGAMMAHHRAQKAVVSITVCRAEDVERFGAVEIANGRVVRFREKAASGPGFINGGTYLLGPEVVSNYPMPPAFSLEHDFLEAHLQTLQPCTWVAEGRFIDIGVPDDLKRAHTLLGHAAE